MSFVVSLALTLLLEGTLALLWGFRRRDLLLFTLANVLTNPLALLLHLLFRGWVVVAAVELAAIVTEGLLFERLGEGIRGPWLFSVFANAFSFSLGLVIDKII